MSPTRFRRLVDIDANPRFVRVAQSPGGRTLLLVLFAGLLIANLVPPDAVAQISVTLALMTFWPLQRRLWLLLGTLAWTLRLDRVAWPVLAARAEALGEPLPLPQLAMQIGGLGLVLVFGLALVWLVRRHPRAPLLRRPLLLLLVSTGGLLMAAADLHLPPAVTLGLWAVVLPLLSYLWFIGYALLDRRAPAAGARGHVLQLGHWQPFWGGGTPTPFPKGAAYLRQIEARDAEQLAVTQLKGLKLIWWALVLTGLLGAMNLLAKRLQIADMDSALAACAAGRALSPAAAWAAVVFNFFHTLLELSIWGHTVIATCRMAGFRALRNTYKPLQATSIAEFWNRYYYYFKELLVEFFFYPVYFRLFKGHPRLRLFCATLAAAGLGNILYHFLALPAEVARHGTLVALGRMHVYMVYGLALGCAIGLSQLRSRERLAGSHWLRRRVCAPAGVLGFYCLLSIFYVPYQSTDLRLNLDLLLSLVGL